MRALLVLLLISFSLLVRQAFAESPQLDNRPGTSPQTEAEALLDHARQLSDIRTGGLPSFRLKAAFSFVGDELETFDGTYTEMWVADSQWRREIVMSDRRRIEVGSATRRWLLDDGKPMPDQAARVSQALYLFLPQSAQLQFESIQNRPDEPSTKCAITKPFSSRNLRDGFCFNVNSGLLVERISPALIHERLADYSCAYSDFRKFGERSFPYEAVCQLSGHRQLQVNVLDLAAATFNDAALFKAPNGALELGRCLGKETTAKIVRTETAIPPAGLRGVPARVTLRLIIDASGKAQNIQVVSSSNQAFDDTAIYALRRWQFKPATCDSEPMPIQTEIPFAFGHPQ